MIRNSNEPMLLAQVHASGAKGIGLGIARDSVESLKPLIAEGLKNDVLLLSGAFLPGSWILLPSQLAAAGVQQIFHGVHMKPGKPLGLEFFFAMTAMIRRCLAVPMCSACPATR